MMLANARFLTQPITGVQRYGIEICRALKKIDPLIRFVAPRNIIYADIAEELGVEVFGHLTGHLWEQIELPIYLRRNGNPLLINLANTAPIMYGNKMVTLHDVAFERFPQTFSWKFRAFYKFAIPLILKSAKNIVTVSEFSKFEISKIYKIKPDNITVVYNSVNSSFFPTKKNKKDKYILAVSSLNHQKNFTALIESFNSLDTKDIKLYLVGAFNKNFAATALQKIIDKNINIVLKGRVTDSELVDLYSNALCFVYPSLYEGFGIPPLEAQACGCPVIVSNVASLPEVCGNSVVYCDPYDVDDIANKIREVVENEDLQDSLKCRGFENINRFSWRESANKIIEIEKVKT